MTVQAIDYGVVADGITDDTTCLLTALATGYHVQLPTGVICISNFDSSTPVLRLLDGQRLIGEGIYNTVIKFVGNDDTPMVGLTGKSGVGVIGLTLNGNSLSGHGIRGGSNLDTLIEDVYIHDVGGYGIGFEEGTNQFNYFNRVKIKNTALDGIDYKNPNNNNDNIFITNVSVDTIGIGNTEQTGIDCRGRFHISNYTARNINGTHVGLRFREDGGGTVGDGGHRSVVSNFTIDTTSTSAYGVYCPATRVQIDNGNVEGAAAIGVYLYGVENVVGNTSVNGADVCFYADDVATYSQLNNCRARNGIKGFRIKADYAEVVSCISKGHSGAGIEITSDSTGALVDACLFRSNGVANIKNGVSTVAGNNSGF